MQASLTVSQEVLADVLVAGTGGGLASALVAAAMARREGRGVLQPLNATSHWVHGHRVGNVADLDVAHSGVGIVTHALSALLWAVPFSIWLAREPDRSGTEILGGAAATAAVAAAVDYLAMPRRLTPGWELALSCRGVGLTFVGLALGLAGGALLARAARGQHREPRPPGPVTSLPGTDPAC
jgi:hypothetical protein